MPQEEIGTLVQKRSEFEHRIAGPRNTPDDFLEYVAWEQSLDTLRARRSRRLNVKYARHANDGAGRTLSIFERAVQRHPGSRLLWRRYLALAAKGKRTKRWRAIMARALRMHPTDAGLWALAGRRCAAVGDMERARAYFMRGCRFCGGEAALWVEYARAEMAWLADMEAKLGKKAATHGMRAWELLRAAETAGEGDVIRFGDDGGDEDEDGEGAELGNEWALLEGGTGAADAEARQGEKEARSLFDREQAARLADSPAMAGAIPMAIFDVARKQPFYGAATPGAFLDMLGEFNRVSVQPGIVKHVLDAAVSQFPGHPATCSCFVRLPILGLEPDKAEFARALRQALAGLKAQMEATDDKAGLAERTVAWIDPILARENLDAGIKAVLEHTKRGLKNP